MARGVPLKPCRRCGGPKKNGTGLKFYCESCPLFSNSETIARYRARHPERVKAQRNFGYKNSPERHLLSAAKYRAKKRGLAFDLTEMDIVIPMVCPVFKTSFAFGRGKGKAIDQSPTLDRIDNSKGYVKGNILVVSWRANRIKGDATTDELITLAKFYGGSNAI